MLSQDRIVCAMQVEAKALAIVRVRMIDDTRTHARARAHTHTHTFFFFCLSPARNGAANNRCFLLKLEDSVYALNSRSTVLGCLRSVFYCGWGLFGINAKRAEGGVAGNDPYLAHDSMTSTYAPCHHIHLNSSFRTF